MSPLCRLVPNSSKVFVNGTEHCQDSDSECMWTNMYHYKCSLCSYFLAFKKSLKHSWLLQAIQVYCQELFTCKWCAENLIQLLFNTFLCTSLGPYVKISFVNLGQFVLTHKKMYNFAKKMLFRSGRNAILSLVIIQCSVCLYTLRIQ